jgi:hypothetical protein
LLTFSVDILPSIFNFLCFCVGTCETATKSLVGEFNHLQSFSWIFSNVQEGLGSGKVGLKFSTTGLGLWLSSQTFAPVLRGLGLFPGNFHRNNN